MKCDIYNCFLKIGGVLGFVPWMNFTTGEITYKTLSKIYLVAIVIGIYLFYRAYSELSTFIISYVIFLVLSTMLVFIQSTCVKQKSWMKWTQLYVKTNNELQEKLRETLKPGFKSVLLITFYTLWLIIMRKDNNAGLERYIEDMVLYMILFSEFLLITFSRILVKGFKIVNKYTKQIHDTTKSRVRLDIARNVNSEKAVFCKNLYKNLYAMSTCFNDIFGWILILNIMRAFISICSFFQILVTWLKVLSSIIFVTFVYLVLVTYYLVSSTLTISN